MTPLILLPLLASMILSCNRSGNGNAGRGDSSVPLSPDTSMKGNFIAPTSLHFDSVSVKAFTDQYPLFAPMASLLHDFYKSREYSYAWFDKKGLIEQASTIHNRLSNLGDSGMKEAWPYKTDLDTLMETAANAGSPQTVTELMLTSQYLQYAKKLYGGLKEGQLKELGWYIPRKKTSLETVLNSFLKEPGKAEPEQHFYRQYGLLQQVLASYKQQAEAGGWPLVEAGKSGLKWGDSSAALQTLRKRLFLSQDLPRDDGSALFDSVLLRGLKKFQARHGLDTNGQLDKPTLSALNVPIEKRIETLAVNMERAKWLPDADTGIYIGINVPEYKLHVYHDDSLKWSMNVVVGSVLNKTVIFAGEVKYVVFSPYWNIPESIVRKEVVPGMKRRGNYLASHQMEVTGYSRGLPIVRQKPGKNNSLGLVKFLFPNSYHIYMHDSPAKNLFNEPNRAFSHGCIRLAEPKKMASFLLSNDPSWTPDKITNAMNAGKEQYVTLKKTVPVYIVYFTAWVDRRGEINYRKDIYQRDERLGQMLYSKN